MNAIASGKLGEAALKKKNLTGLSDTSSLPFEEQYMSVVISGLHQPLRPVLSAREPTANADYRPLVRCGRVGAQRPELLEGL